MPIPDEVLARPAYRHVVCPAEATVGQAVAMLQEAEGQPWWPIVIDFGDGRYGLTWVQSLARRAGLLSDRLPQRAPPIQAQLSALARRTESLTELEPDAMLDVVEQDSLSTEEALELARRSPGRALVVVNAGRLVGLLIVRATKSAGRFGPRAH